MEQEIINAYSENFTSAHDIYKKLNKKYTLKQIKNVLKFIYTNQIIGKKQENKDLEISISAPSGSFQADLTFYSQFKRQNHGYDILLTIIEINTRFAYAFPLKDKKAESILACLKELLDTKKQNLKSISFDQGSEFDNRLVKDFLDENNIKYIFFNKAINPNVTSMIERFNRAIRDRISKYQSFHKQKNFIDELTKIVHSYNNTEYSQINMTPQKAKEANHFDEKSNQNKLEVLQKIEEKFEIGDFVRIFRVITKINNPIAFLIFQTILEKIDQAFFIKIIKKIFPAKCRYLFQISEQKNSQTSLKVLVTGLLTTLSIALSKPSSKATFPASITPAFLVISQASGIDVNPSFTQLKNPKNPAYLSFLSWYFLSSSSFINFILSLSLAYSSQSYLLFS